MISDISCSACLHVVATNYINQFGYFEERRRVEISTGSTMKTIMGKLGT